MTRKHIQSVQFSNFSLFYIVIQILIFSWKIIWSIFSLKTVKAENANIEKFERKKIQYKKNKRLFSINLYLSLIAFINTPWKGAGEENRVAVPD